MLSEYRQRFGAYHTEVNREDYLFRTGRKKNRETRQITGEYSDLFENSVVKELGRLLKEVADYRETERESIKRLISFAVRGNLAARVREVTEEIEALENSAQIDWIDWIDGIDGIDGEGRKIWFHQSAELLANESDTLRRRELAARRADVIKSAQDLRSERIAIMHEAAREFAYPHYAAMQGELLGIDYQSLAGAAQAALSKSDSVYTSALAQLLIGRAKCPIEEAVAADLGYLQRFDEFDVFFPPARMIESYRALCAGLGFRSERQENVELESGIRQGGEAFCAPLAVPEEIKLVSEMKGGQLNYREFLRAAGETQGYAWTSNNLSPEFCYPNDRALKASWGMLFENLLLDGLWLQRNFGFMESESFRRVLAILRLMGVRGAAAKLDYELEFHSGRLLGNAGLHYAETMTEAVRVGFDETGHLRYLSDYFQPADHLRACALESQLREHLKSRFGLRWWDSRKAGEMLIDLWNTGERYTTEELASLIGLGRLDFDWLA
ncbi:MAG: hypothetical protein J2P41_16910, partial [Blastocatellia bacterium]|nr:hypothetical protein [Blastocatellia bacterium]